MAATQAPAGWYEDPLNPGGKRLWDGAQWTHQTEQPPPAPPAPAPLDLFAGAAGFVGQAGTSLLPATNDMRHSETYFAADEQPAWKRKRVLIPSLALLLGLGVGAVAIGVAVFGSGDTTETAAGGVEAADGSADQQVNGLIGEPENADSTALTTSTALPTTVRQTSSIDRSSTTEASTTTSAPESTTPAAPTTAAPTTAVPTTVAPTTAAPTTVAPTAAAPTTAASTTVAPTTAAPTTAAPTTAAPTTAAPTTAAPTTADCHPAYSPCLPYSPGDAYNCVDLSDSQKPVKVYDHNVDPYGLDSDNDGVGCESG